MKEKTKIRLSLLIVIIMIIPLSPPIQSSIPTSEGSDYWSQGPNGIDEDGHLIPVSSASQDNSIYLSLYGTNVAASSTLSFFGATWSSLGRWQFGYEFVGAGSSGNFDLINGAGMYITEKTNANNLHMLATTDETVVRSRFGNKGTDRLGGRHIDFERSEQVALLSGYFVQDQFAPHPGHLQLGELVDHIRIPDLSLEFAL